MEAFAELLRATLQRATSFGQVGARRVERFYSGFGLALISMLSGHYHVVSEQASGSGRAAVLRIPKLSHGHEAIVLAYKVAKSVAKAICYQDKKTYACV